MKDLYFKGHITKISKNEMDMNAIPIVFKIIYINTIPVAQEICTKKVFPIFYLHPIENIKFREIFLEELYVVFSADLKQKIPFFINEKDINDLLSHYRNSKFNNLTANFSLNNSNFNESYFIFEMKLNSFYIKEIEDKYKANKNLYDSFSTIIEKSILNDDDKKIVYLNDFQNSYVDTEEIEDFGFNLSNQENLCNLIGREDEIKKIIKTLCIRKNSVLLVGEAGCGKTSIVEKLALDIKEGNNKWLKGKTIFYVNAAALEAGTKYRGDFEEKILELINFSKEHKENLILFIDEVHSLYGLGKGQESSTDAMNILKPYISNGDITIIGATTNEEYEKYMTSDQAFLRRFEKIDIELPSKEMMMDILLAYIDELEEKYSIKLELDSNKRKELMDKIIELTDSKHQRIIGDVKTTNPTLAKYILADAFAEAVYNEKDVVTIEDICVSIETCSKITPSTRKKISEELKEDFISHTYIDEDKKTNVIELNPQKKLSTIS